MTKPINQPIDHIEVHDVSWSEFVRAGGQLLDNETLDTKDFVDTKPTEFVDTAFDDVRDVDL